MLNSEMEDFKFFCFHSTELFNNGYQFIRAEQTFISCSITRFCGQNTSPAIRDWSCLVFRWRLLRCLIDLVCVWECKGGDKGSAYSVKESWSAMILDLDRAQQVEVMRSIGLGFFPVYKYCNYRAGVFSSHGCLFRIPQKYCYALHRENFCGLENVTYTMLKAESVTIMSKSTH